MKKHNPTQRFGFNRLEGYAGPIARIIVDGVEKDIFHESELPKGGAQGVKLYNQVPDSGGEPSHPVKK